MTDLADNHHDLVARTEMDRRLVEIVEPAVTGMGYRLVRLRLTGGGRPTLQIMAERPDGRMEIEDCAELSHMLSALLDVEDPIHGQYVLEVSSPGIDRPLTRLEDFERWAGHEAKVELAEPREGRRRFKGRLLGVRGEAVLIETGGRQEALPFAEVVEAKLVLTDALLRESLGRRGADEGGGTGKGKGEGAVVDPQAFDAVEYEDDEESGAREVPHSEEDE